MRRMKRTSLLLLLAACGGGAASSGPTATSATAASPSDTAAAAPTDTATAAPDDSPPSIGNRHKKVGNGWFLSGSGKSYYDAIYEPGAQPVVYVKQTSDAAGRWMTLMKNVAAAPYSGKKIRVRIGVKTAGVTGRGEVWARAAAPRSPEDAPATSTPLTPTSGMKTYEVTIDVKDNARVIEYGVSLAGPGEFRVGQDAIDVVP
jgi:hypothetical protein